jgi:hypothetical protein
MTPADEGIAAAKAEARERRLAQHREATEAPTGKPAKQGSVEVSRGQQSIDYVGLFSAPKHKLRLRVKYDSYRDQSLAVAERWSGSKWEQVCSIMPPKLAGWRQGIAYERGADRAESFKSDVTTLLERAKEVLDF